MRYTLEEQEMSQLENFTYEEITIGQTASYSKQISEQDVQLFAAVSGDVNPVHLDEAFAAATQFKGRIAHGMLTGALVSAALAMELPGPGTIYLGQELSFKAPVFFGDTITAECEVIEKQDDRRIIKLATTVRNQDDKVVITGTATVKK